MRFPLKQTAAVYRYMRGQKKAGNTRFPLVLMLEPLHACNLACSGCGRIREYKSRMSEMVPLEKCLKAAQECGAPVVSICGGEPLIYPDIGDLVVETVKMGKVTYLCTNGQVLENKLGLFKPSKLFNINVHIDGLAATHDAIVEKKGAFDKAISGIKNALRAGFTVCTNTTVYNQSDPAELTALVSFLEDVGIHGILISPGFDYTDVENRNVFMDRGAIINKFKSVRKHLDSKHVWSTPIFLDFVSGKRDLTCTPWGNVTYNVAGWKAPCYLITDGHYENFDDFISKVDWTKYGPGKDPRCANCMVHSGFESTVALTIDKSIRDTIRMARWTLF